MRLIDADYLREQIQRRAESSYGLTREVFELMVNVLDVTGTVDAVEVVRCKDCKYRPVGTGCNHDLEFPVHYKCPCECEDYWYSWMPKDNFFCSNGERKTDETD